MRTYSTPIILVSRYDPVMDFAGAGGEEIHKSSVECGGGVSMTQSGVTSVPFPVDRRIALKYPSSLKYRISSYPHRATA